ncbi:MAG: GNAT family N-acetyltransferase [Gammaproteobacteria bacterium]|nr:GNAT family N-acetyltransferase [Gammaproteobacteria bacterium]
MKCHCYTDWEALPASANRLFEEAEKESAFFSRQWFESLINTSLSDDQELKLVCVEDGQDCLAILPLVAQSATTWVSLRHRYTPHFSLLLADRDREQTLACLARGLRDLAVKGILLEPVADDDEKLVWLEQALSREGFVCDRLFRHYNWIYTVQGRDYSEYLAQRPTRLRNTLQRKRRKLAREHEYKIRLFSGEQVLPKMQDYYRVYRDSWKADEQYRELVDDMIARFSSAGWTRLGILYIEGRPAAAQLWFVCHGKASIFRLSYDEAWKMYSPGSILMAYLMEFVIDTEKVEEVDFLTGNDSYKQDWMSERREQQALCCVRQTSERMGLVARIDSIWRTLRNNFINKRMNDR